MKRTLLVLALMLSPLMADPSQDAFDAAVARYEKMAWEKYGDMCDPAHPLYVEARRLLKILDAANDPLMSDASHRLVIYDMAAVRLGYARAVVDGAAPPVAARRPAAPSAVASELSKINKQLRANEEQRRLEFLMEFSQRTGKR